MTQPKVAWLFPAAFIVHDVEETATVGRWLERHGAHLERFAQTSPASAAVIAHLPKTTTQFGAAALVLFAVILMATIAFVAAPRNRAARTTYFLMFAVFAVHALWHIGWSIYFGVYTPGVVTAIAVIPPVTYAVSRLIYDAVD